MMLGVSWINSQIAFDGIVQGMAIAVIAVGVVLVYRATRIINFAVGNMGVIGATLLSLLVVQYHVPFWVALAVALVVGLVLGAIVDATIIRRLRKSPRVVVLVATIGVAQIAEAIAFKIPQPTSLAVHYPSAFNFVVDRGWGADPRLGSFDPDHRPGHAHRVVLVPGPDHARQDGQGLCQQSPTGTSVQHQSQGGFDIGMGARRRPVDPVDRAHCRTDRLGR